MIYELLPSHPYGAVVDLFLLELIGTERKMSTVTEFAVLQAGGTFFAKNTCSVNLECARSIGWRKMAMIFVLGIVLKTVAAQQWHGKYLQGTHQACEF